ncbi:hypothetical protein [Streptomyces albus]|uniref:hypothetical protein n=1 Tax=Streptomyces albus TaxID=1888 RepID=UPI003F5131C2
MRSTRPSASWITAPSTVATKPPGPTTNNYGVFFDYRNSGPAPWEGAVTTGLRDAIERYVGIWFPGACATSTPSRAPGRTAHTTSAPPVTSPAAQPAPAAP